MRATPADWAMLVALGLIWGAAFMATKIATADFTPLTLAGFRLAVAAGVLALVLALRGERLPGLGDAEARRFWAAALAVAVLSNAMPFTSLAWAQRHVPSSLAGVLMATVPLFLLPIAHLFVPGERMTLRRTAGFLLGFAGVCVLIGPAALEGLEAGAGAEARLRPLAIGGCLLAAFGYAAGSVVSKRAPQLGLLRFATAALILAALLTLPLALVVEDIALPSAESVAALAYLGVVPTALATVFLLSVIRSAGPSFLANVNYHVPVWAVVLGAAVLGETPSPRLGVALVLILAGLAVAQNLVGLRRGAVPRG